MAKPVTHTSSTTTDNKGTFNEKNSLVQVGSMMKSKIKGKLPYIKMDDYHGTLIFRDKYGYETPVTFMVMARPNPDAPDYVMNKLLISTERSDNINGDTKQQDDDSVL